MIIKGKISRCAVYTRKSTEHNLDLEFNSLHAQREACEAYIKSQFHEGWRLISDQYDDGGISGATLDRPDLQRLLIDIGAGKVDTVVVYKVDRLTRSLTDFAKLVEVFDQYKVSFVSVTQAFNTTTSMGRLTLNVLLSFAQFEREVIGERVRDKIAASKKKGLWMGGTAPLGYTNRDKKLVIVPEEAEQVRWIFSRYLELSSMDLLIPEMVTLKIQTKAQVLFDGRRRGGGSFSKGALAHLLKNRCYIGEISHHGQVYPADHQPILDRDIFDAVQARLGANAVARRLDIKGPGFLLAGLLFDDAGNRMSPSHSRKKGLRYRYYVSQAVLQSRVNQGSVRRISALHVESVIERFVRGRVARHEGELASLIRGQVSKIIIKNNVLDVYSMVPGSGDGANEAQPAIVSLPWSKTSPHRSAGTASEAGKFSKAKVALLGAIARARAWVDQLSSGVELSEIARQEGKGICQIRLLIPLAFVPPTKLRELIEGNSSPGIMELARQVHLSWSSSF